MRLNSASEKLKASVQHSHHESAFLFAFDVHLIYLFAFYASEKVVVRM